MKKAVPSRAEVMKKVMSSYAPMPIHVISVLSPQTQSDHMVVQAAFNASPVTVNTSIMIDSGATTSFINQSFVDSHRIPTTPRQFPFAVHDVDGRSLGTVNREVTAHIRLGAHEERITLNVLSTGRYPVIFGLPWLKTSRCTHLFLKVTRIASSISKS